MTTRQGIQKPNCGNCDKALSCDNKRYDCACLLHPGAREYLNEAVIKELERRSNADRTAHASSNVRKGTLEECISLLKEGRYDASNTIMQIL